MWKLESNDYVFSKQMVEESLYMTGNGYLGIRASFEEGYPEGDSIRGSYINGLYDRIPMIHAEMAYGFPEIQDKQPRIIDTQGCKVYLDGEEAKLFNGRYEGYNRILDYKKGISKRSYTFITNSGKKAKLSFKRLASLQDKNVFIYSVTVKYDGEIKLISTCDAEIENFKGINDPRTGAGHKKLMEIVSLDVKNDLVYALMKTISTNILQSTIIRHRVCDCKDFSIEYDCEDKSVSAIIIGKGSISLEKLCVFTDEIREENPVEAGNRVIESYDDIEYKDMEMRQENILNSFWDNCGIEIKGCPKDKNSIRFMQYQLLQSVGTDEFSNISAKGLSGEGYEGHYFWDTEIYMLPVMLLNQQEKAKKLLEYRYRILPYALKRARELGHLKGAAYPWRTISGIECSGYFPAGTAQYHINSDIAYGFLQYYFFTDDLEFLLNKGFEVIVETGRIWIEIGNFYNGTFQIHSVTGPDEYTAIVNNNYYTNMMAKYHLKLIFELFNFLKNNKDEIINNKGEYLLKKLSIDEDEIKLMKEASDKMLIPYDENLGINIQDDSFLSKPDWPFGKISKKKRPLLLHFHPLTIYRHKVLKQADTVLAHMLLEDYVDSETIKNSFNYYEKITTHDSSLSSCIYGIVASRCGFKEKAYDYFNETVNLDLKDTHGNTKDGLHMASIAGTILSVVSGFAGLKVNEYGIFLNPNLPDVWREISFKMRYKGRKLLIGVGESVEIEVLEGNPLKINVNGKKHIFGLDKNKFKAFVFDLDGVLTDTSSKHYEAWNELSVSLGYNLPASFEDELRGISRMDSLEKVLEYCGLKDKYSKSEKIALATKKNNIYIDKISNYSKENLFEGVLELLELLKENGFKIALASASKSGEFLLKAMNIYNYFDAVVDPSSINNGKPAPDIFLNACEKINVIPQEAIGVEDAFSGIESIKAAGLFPIGFGKSEVLSNCDITVKNLNEIIDAINCYKKNYKTRISINKLKKKS